MFTLDELKAFLGITDNSQNTALTLIMNAALEYVEQVTLLNYGADKTRTEVHDYRDNIYLQRMGVKTITSIKIWQTGTDTEADAITIAAGQYTWNKLGRITLDQLYGDDSGRYDYNTVHITYTYGKETGETAPADLKLAALQIAREYRDGTAGSDSRRVVSESTGSYRIQLDNTSPITETLNRYRVPRA